MLIVNKKSILQLLMFIGIISAGLIAFKLNNIISQKIPPKPHLLLITVDTLRPDHLNIYGYKRNTSPAISRLGKDSFVFNNAFTVAANSGPSHATLLTGLYPPQHGLMGNGEKINSKILTLAQTLGQAGYDTAGFVSYYALNNESGLDKGFQHFEFNPIASHHHDTKTLKEDLKGFVAVTTWLESWAKSPEKTPEKSPFFIWFHVQNVHGSYDPPPPYNSMFGKAPEPQRLENFEGIFDPRCFNDVGKAWRHGILPDRFKDEVTALYDGEIRLVDDQLGKLFDLLKSLEVYDDTVISIVSDHGEVLFELYENGFYKQGLGHGARYTDASIHVPLIIKPTKGHKFDKKFRIEKMISTINLFPTFLELLKFPVPTELPGVSLVPIMHRPKSAFAAPDIYFHEKPWGVEYAGIQTDKWKYMTRIKKNNKTNLLIDRKNDPSENRNVYYENLGQANKLSKKLELWKQNIKSVDIHLFQKQSEKMHQALVEGGYIR
jgi:arylsulfatase A-like enzyme